MKLLGLIVAARILGKQPYGELGAFQSTVLMFALFAGMGLGLSATKHVAQFRVTDPARAGRIIGTSFVLAALSGGLFSLALFAGAPALTASVLGAPHLEPLFKLGAALVFFHAILGAQTGALAGLEAFPAVAGSNLLHGVCSFAILILAVRYGGLYGAVLGLVGAAAVGAAITQLFVFAECRRAGVRTAYLPNAEDWKLFASFSLPAVLRGGGNSAVNWAAAAILVNQRNGFAEMAVFSAANQWRMLMLLMPSILERISLPILANLRSEGNEQRYRQAVRRQTLVSLFSAACLAIPVSLAAPVVIGLYGESFRSGWMTIPLLASSALLASVNNATAIAFMSRGAAWFSFRFDAAWAVSLVAFAALLAPAYGAIGLAAAYPGAGLVHSLLLLACGNCFATSKGAAR
ncbi:MAG: oligosaccharide flippase family protein [Bryobacteraceae bacterium]|nr:oligosaccharide flippase family protein [Bryobacteraceae bacterium]